MNMKTTNFEGMAKSEIKDYLISNNEKIIDTYKTPSDWFKVKRATISFNRSTKNYKVTIVSPESESKHTVKDFLSETEKLFSDDTIKYIQF